MKSRSVLVASGWALALLWLAGLLGCAAAPTDAPGLVRPVATVAVELVGPPASASTPAGLEGAATPAHGALPPRAALGGGRSCVHNGDPTGDGVVSSGDAQRAFYIALGIVTPTPDEFCAADCNGDGVVSSGDAQLIFYVALGSGTCVGEIEPAQPVVVSGAGHVRGTTASGLRVRFGFGLVTPVGTSTPTAPGHSADFGAYPVVKDF